MALSALAMEIKFSYEGSEEALARVFGIRERSELALYKMLYQQGFHPTGTSTLSPQLLDQVQQLALPPSIPPVPSPVPPQYVQQPSAPLPTLPQYVQQQPAQPSVAPAPSFQRRVPYQPKVDRFRWVKLLLPSPLRFAQAHPGVFGVFVLAPAFAGLMYFTPLGKTVSDLIPDFPKKESVPTPEPTIAPGSPAPTPSPSPSPESSEPKSGADLMRDRINRLSEPAVP